MFGTRRHMVTLCPTHGFYITNSENNRSCDKQYLRNCIAVAYNVDIQVIFRFSFFSKGHISLAMSEVKRQTLSGGH